jgi:hypothetical protein
MSIIYDALKKVDGDKKSPQQPGPKPRRNIALIVGSIVALAVITSAIYYVTRRNFHMDIKPLVMFKSAPLNSFGRPAPRKVFNTYVLEGIIYDDKGPIAVINGQVLHMGEKIDTLELKKVEAKSVELIDAQDNSTVSLSL